MDVSEVQLVASHAERPILEAIDTEVSPKPATNNDMLAEPVTARFACVATLKTAASNDKITVAVPACLPTVCTSRRLPAAPPCPMMHIIDVSACHIVCSHAVTPVRAPDVERVCPMLAPCRVTLDEPVAARFARLTILLLTRSAEPALVTLPTFLPKESETRRLPAALCSN